jgi:hypothetical protein
MLRAMSRPLTRRTWVDRNYRLVNRIVVSYLGRDVAEIEPSTAVSESPTSIRTGERSKESRR